MRVPSLTVLFIPGQVQGWGLEVLETSSHASTAPDSTNCHEYASESSRNGGYWKFKMGCVIVEGKSCLKRKWVFFKEEETEKENNRRVLQPTCSSGNTPQTPPTSAVPRPLPRPLHSARPLTALTKTIRWWTIFLTQWRIQSEAIQC